MIDGISRAQALIAERFSPDGFNVGFNEGAAAGQTIPHFHIHVIPRKHGDMDDPRGGVRHVIPSKGNYLAKTDLAPLPTVTTPDEDYTGWRAWALEQANAMDPLMDGSAPFERLPPIEAWDWRGW